MLYVDCGSASPDVIAVSSHRRGSACTRGASRECRCGTRGRSEVQPLRSGTRSFGVLVGILAIARGRNAAQTSRSVSKQNAPTSVARALRFAMRQTSIINLSMTFLKCSLKRVSAQMRCGALPTVRVGPLGRLRGPLGPRPAFCNDPDSAADDKGTGTDLRCADTHGQQNSEACGVPGRPSGYPCSTGRELRTRPKGAFSGAAMAAIAGPRHEAVIDAEPAGRSHRKRN